MKKLIAILFFILIPTSLFAFYGDGSGRSFIDFLMDKNQLRAQTDKIGILAGTSHIRVAAGFTGRTSGIILDNFTNDYDESSEKLRTYFRPAVSFAI